jgi:hypothetical protein
LPDAPEEIATKVALLVAVHAHPDAAVTGTDPDPPAAPNAEAVMAPAETVQDGAVVVVELLLSLEHETNSSRTVAVRRRRSENGMNADYLPLAAARRSRRRARTEATLWLGRDYMALTADMVGSVC